MGSGMPQVSSGPWKKWRNTSDSKSSPCRTTKPLDTLKVAAAEFLSLDGAKDIQVSFENGVPKQDDILILLGMWIHIAVKGEAADPSELLHNLAPLMGEAFVERWSDRYYAMNVGRKTNVA